MIHINRFDNSSINVNSILTDMSLLLNNGPNLLGGIFSTVIKETEDIVGKFLNKKVTMTSSGTASLLMSIEYAFMMADSKDIEIYVSEYLYFSIHSYLSKFKVNVIKSDIDEVTLRYPEFDPSKFNIFVLTSHHHTNVNVNEIISSIPKSNRFIIEDRCLMFNRDHVVSDAACYSFANNKLVNCGEGGCIASDNLDFINWAKTRSYSDIRKTDNNPNYFYLGKYSYNKNDYPFKCSINSLSCIMIKHQIEQIDDIVKKRKLNYSILYNELNYSDHQIKLPDYPLFYDLVLPFTFDKRHLNYFQLNLLNNGIQTHLGVLPVYFYKSELLDKNIISLPIHGLLTEDDIDNIINSSKRTINDITRRKNKTTY